MVSYYITNLNAHRVNLSSQNSSWTPITRLSSFSAVVPVATKMAPSKYSVDTLSGAKELIDMAMKTLELPSGHSRPYLNVSSLLKESATSPVAFTESEAYFIQHLCHVQTKACQSVVYPRGIFDVLLDMLSADQSKINNLCSQWWHAGSNCHMEKMIKFSTDLEFFKQ